MPPGCESCAALEISLGNAPAQRRNREEMTPDHWSRGKPSHWCQTTIMLTDPILNHWYQETAEATDAGQTITCGQTKKGNLAANVAEQTVLQRPGKLVTGKPSGRNATQIILYVHSKPHHTSLTNCIDCSRQAIPLAPGKLSHVCKANVPQWF